MSEGEAEITEVRAAHRFDEARLEAWLDGRLEGFRRPLTVRQFEGGHSNPTFLIQSHDRRWVVRKKPPGDLLPSAHQVGREYTVLKALGGSDVPVPTVRLHCEDASVIGSEFFVMDWVEGRIFLDPSLPGMTPAERRAIFIDYLKVLARLHAVDPATVGLSDYGRPGNFYERQISRWVRQYKAAQTDDHADMESLMAWLPANMPAESETRIVHGDFSIRNCMLHPTEPRLEAVLDWELSTLGDPYSDVAYTTLFMMGETTQKTLIDLGIPSQAEIFEIYAEASGRPPLKDWSFHLAFTLFRIAAINQGVYKRGLDGNASSDRYVEAYPSIQRFAARAWSIVNRGPAVV